MSAYLYDKALVEKLESISGDTRIRVISPDNALSFLAHIGDEDKVSLPAIVLQRGPIRLLSERNQVVALKGETAKVDDQGHIVKAQLVPVHMEWNIDVYAVDRYTCDEIIRELTFFFIMNPRFNVKIPYNLDIDQNFDIFLEEDIEDNTDLINFVNTGEMFRETLGIYTDNAHFYWSHKQYQTYVKPDVVE